ncbi:MAG: phytanoyl-CoA dioxygenase family protein [Phycisphaerales bacterium]|nr:phytanoyl-CoA dioxygenase family protein [Phycisphaerales bacterium]
MAAQTQSNRANEISQQTIDAYRRDGFVRVNGIISKQEAAEYRQAAIAAAAANKSNTVGDIFTQHVNIWRVDEAMRRLTFHPNVTAVARKLAEVPLRLWHDQILIKKPHNNTPTEFHQDQPYWPHNNSTHPISIWIALCDVPPERGCMTFIPGFHNRNDLAAQDLGDARSMFEMCPEMQWESRVTVPLRAGDCTFHHGRCPHQANANSTDEPRVAHAVIFVDASTTYSGTKHIVTDPLGMKAGAVLDGELFPIVGE